MEEEYFFGASYKGTKKFDQWEVPTANATGFGAAADDFMERGIDLNEQLVKNKPATFFFRMRGDAMTDAGIHPGDVLVVDRSIKPVNGKIIVAIVNDELVVRRLHTAMNKNYLLPENKRFSTIELTEFGQHMVWGTVTFVIKSV